ncbi:hypothetical protein SLEP1_g31949 [Rubroshorea leprosula]|uniref:Uncharacterized protein n=1 Tax=Rubroshorea leprosula TaxID=152421 RepID=A0AAV5KBU3_9ROSI|nr:hypothetical protein SLEP1_g31949 [Rubroshorea leprosula]
MLEISSEICPVKPAFERLRLLNFASLLNPEGNVELRWLFAKFRLWRFWRLKRLLKL